MTPIESNTEALKQLKTKANSLPDSSGGGSMNFKITKVVGYMPYARSGATVWFYKNGVEQEKLSFLGLTDTEEYSVNWEFDLSKDFIDFYIQSPRSYDRVGFYINGNTIYLKGFTAS